MSENFGLEHIINKQLNTLLLAQQFLKTNDISDPKLGGEIWKVLTHNNENKNLIAVAALANPVRKLEDRNYTFKLKLDIFWSAEAKFKTKGFLGGGK